MTWQLWRQDDNGQRFLVETFAEQRPAQALLDELEARMHKQIYWLSQEAAREEGA